MPVPLPYCPNHSLRSSTAQRVFLALLFVPLGACATIRQDEIGVKTRFGRVSSGPLNPGAQFVLPGVSSVLRIPSRVVNREVRLELPTREGLNVAAEVSILYRARPDSVARILARSGLRYEDDVIIPVFRSAAADVSARFMAKDLHSGTRAGIETAIKTQMMAVLEPRGFEVENVLLKSIAWAIIAQGLTPSIISYQSLEAFRELARSPNAKVIVTDGKTPMLLSSDGGITDGSSARANSQSGASTLSAPTASSSATRRLDRAGTTLPPR